MRSLPANLLRRLREESLFIAVLVDIDHPGGRTLAWSGSGELDALGEVFNGLGLIGRVQSNRSTTEIRIQTTRFILSGLPQDIEGRINESVRGRRAKVYIAFLDEDFRCDIEPILVNETVLDRQNFRLQQNGTAELFIEGFNGFKELEIASAIRWSAEDQKKTHPSDKGLDRVHLIENREVTWTRN